MNNNSHQNPDRSSATSSSELPWLAFCYVANELDANARREFEIRLEHDQTAREAVAQAFDDAWMLDRALSQNPGEVPTSAGELAQPKSKPAKRPSREKSKSAWPVGLLGLGIAGLLALALLQITWKPAPIEVTQNTSSTMLSERTNTSVTLAETWADSEWDAELENEIGESETDLAHCDQSNYKQESVIDDDQDDWMTATLIDMAEELDTAPLQSGS